MSIFYFPPRFLSFRFPLCFFSSRFPNFLKTNHSIRVKPMMKIVEEQHKLEELLLIQFIPVPKRHPLSGSWSPYNEQRNFWLFSILIKAPMEQAKGSKRYIARKKPDIEPGDRRCTKTIHPWCSKEELQGAGNGSWSYCRTTIEIFYCCQILVHLK